MYQVISIIILFQPFEDSGSSAQEAKKENNVSMSFNFEKLDLDSSNNIYYNSFSDC